MANSNDERGVSSRGAGRDVATTTRETAPDRERRIAAPCDAYETADRIVILADMPGVDQEHLEVTLHRGTLLMRGRAGKPVPEHLRPFSDDDATTVYERTLQVASSIDPEKVSATMSDGVLRIELAKPQEERPRRIAINRG
ncbi:MAG TPA: Hsp20/alpha crystallin family protein [Planctomycetota bacterium]|nr:Hsp20/alpha crystallin family protein [Planctomycetota bacterium]